jgi:hypothetical protein
VTAVRRELTDRQLNTEPIPDETYMLCALCPHEEWVSPEDPDCSQGLLVNHLQSKHGLEWPHEWGPVLAQTKVVTES